MKQLRFEVGDRVYRKDNPSEGLFEIADECIDREGYYTYNLSQVDDEGGNFYSGEYAEGLIPEDEYRNGYGPETCEDVKNEITCPFPKFKSYGLTREQVFEVMNLYVDSMIELMHSLMYEAIDDRNHEFANSYLEDMQVLLKFRLMEDRLWHRFVDGN